MKSLLIKDLTESFVKDSFLKTIKPDVLNIRNQFYDFAKNLNSELGTILINHFNERIKRANETLMLGEYAPFIFGDLFKISYESINKVAFTWFLMYEYSLLLDDLLDKERENWKLELLSSQILLDNSFKKFFLAINNQIDIYNSFEKYRKESIDAMISELKCSNMKSIRSNVIIQGRKAALVKFCVSYMINIDKKREISEEEESILDNICAGIQLLDDLTDFMEDHIEGRLNLMLSFVYNWIENNYQLYNRKNINNDQLIAGLIVSQSLNTTLEFSHNLLKSACQLKGNKKITTGSIEYFNELAENCIIKSDQIDNILQIQKVNISKYMNCLFENVANKTYFNSENKEYMNNKFLEILSFVPKASN
jgi:hypothetical protein